MTTVISAEELAAAIPGIPDPWQQILLEAVNSAITRYAPCLTGDGAGGALAEARLIGLRAVDRLVETPAYAASETRGPFSITYLTGGRSIFDASDITALQALCPGAGAQGAHPIGAFPPAGHYDHLFARPPRRGGGHGW